jgi:hypothetical protein
MSITLQLQGDMVHVTFSRAESHCDRVKVYAPRSTLKLDEMNRLESGHVFLAQGATMHIDVYGEEGEGHFLSQDYRREETGLVLVKTHWNDGIQVVVSQEQAS